MSMNGDADDKRYCIMKNRISKPLSTEDIKTYPQKRRQISVPQVGFEPA